MSLFKKNKPKKNDDLRRTRRSASDLKKQESLKYGSTRQDVKDLAGREKQRLSKKQIEDVGLFQYWLRRIGLLILLLAITASLTSILTVSSDVEIVIDDQNNSSAFLRDSNSEYEVAARSLLNKSLLNRNKLTINSESIENGIKDKFAEISGVELKIPLFAHRPIIHIRAEIPSVVLNSTGGSYALSRDGYALMPSGKLPSSVRDKLPQVNDQSGIAINIGGQALPSDNVAFINEVVGQLREKNIEVESFTIPIGTSELDAKVAGQAYSVKFNLHPPPDVKQQIGTFLATKAMLERKSIPITQYIDVRVEGRAYYR